MDGTQAIYELPKIRGDVFCVCVVFLQIGFLALSDI